MILLSISWIREKQIQTNQENKEITNAVDYSKTFFEGVQKDFVVPITATLC